MLRAILCRRGWTFPLILKPDIGERGAGVKLARSLDDAIDYLAQSPCPIVIQPFHPGPYEAGIFYYRHPEEARGHIFSITDKHFSDLIGDGVLTVEELIWRHPRYRMQAGRFLERHKEQSQRVLASGEKLRLAMAGNHCQGTMFCDGSHLITPELENAIDEIAKRFAGFHFGRFDVRYSNPDQLKAGKDFCVIELNGVTSESTNIYDPRSSLLGAYRTLARQWRILFSIGQANTRRGEHKSHLNDLAREIFSHCFRQRANPLSD